MLNRYTFLPEAVVISVPSVSSLCPGMREVLRAEGCLVTHLKCDNQGPSTSPFSFRLIPRWPFLGEHSLRWVCLCLGGAVSLQAVISPAFSSTGDASGTSVWSPSGIDWNGKREDS